MTPFTFIFKIRGYGLIAAEARVTMNLDNGKVTGIEMNPECFAGVKDRWSLVQEIEEIASRTHHALYMSGKTIDADALAYQMEVENQYKPAI